MESSRKTELALRGAFGVALALLVVIGFASYFSLQRLTNNSALLARSHEAMSLIDEIVYDTARAEGAQRGFVITGDEQFVNNFQEIVNGSGQRWERLEELLSGQP